jgi:hypothetical protein
MMFEILKKYKSNGFYDFSLNGSYKDSCNAPSNRSGIYLIYKIIDDQEVLIYIGSSGQRDKNGDLKTRKGGMKDRLVNGYHPNKFDQVKRIKRSVAFPKYMLTAKIDKIRVYWWVTFDDENVDYPTDVETLLRNEYLLDNMCLPEWHRH